VTLSFPILAVLLVSLPAAIARAEGAEAPPSDVIPAPKLLSPRHGMDLTDVATFFQWEEVAGCSSYDLQIARDPEFRNLYKERRTRDVRYHTCLCFPKDVPPPGRCFWRVRAVAEDREGPWSAALSVNINADHFMAKEAVMPIGAEHPVFLMRNRAWDPSKGSAHLREIIPAGLERVIVPDDIFIGRGTEDAIARARTYDELGVNFVVWNNRAQVSLATLEYLFQNFPHCIGTAEGEHFWSWRWERGPEGNVSEWDYVPRAWTLCAKYGRYYFLGDGEAGTYTWTQVSDAFREELQRYRAFVVPMFKSTIGHVALHSMGAVEGLLAAGWVDNCGFWADEFVWGECGFGKLGEMNAAGDGGDRECPYSYDIQMWLMGIAGGATVFHLESAHQWTAEGKGAANYQRYYLPFVTAVVRHDLIPSREAFLKSIKVAVACDPERARERHGDRYEGAFGFLNELYALRHRPFQEIIPDNSRYGIIALLPPSSGCADKATRAVPQEELLPPGRAAAMFIDAYPRRFEGDAFMWECDGTVIITNCRENEESRQTFAMRLGRGPVKKISGAVAVHDYIIGKLAEDEHSAWFQANFGFDSQSTRNVPNPDRRLELVLDCSSEPQVVVTPPSAKVAGAWDVSAGRYALTLSMKDGPAEFEVRP
jgi:hypothetical protein